MYSRSLQNGLFEILSQGYFLKFYRVVEAIMDAGINPKELEGTNTLVCISAINLIDQKLCFENLQHMNFAVMG